MTRQQQQYYQYIQHIALDVRKLIGDAYDKNNVGEYFHGLLEHYPERVDPKQITKDVLRLTGRDQSLSATEIIDTAEQTIRKHNNGTLPFGAMMELRMLRQKYK